MQILENSFILRRVRPFCNKTLLICLISCQFPLLVSAEINGQLSSAEVSQQKQEVTITGNIVDDDNLSIIGANIALKGTSRGTVTDLDGNFSLTVPVGSTLVITYMGYASREVAVTAKNPKLLITLKPSAVALRDVVVQVGYGGVKRANLLGAVSSLKAKEIEDIVTGNLSTALRGTMAGVIIGQASGAPGASTSIQIRIPGSWNSENPLFVIDGFVRDQSAFDILDPSEVESISVLKDAAAAVYGARSAGGVILVTTKKGKTGKTKVSYSGTVGISDATRFPELMSAYDHAIALNDYTRGYYKWNDADVLSNAKTDKQTYFSQDELNQLNSIDNNWLQEGWKSALQTRHNIGVSGGTDNVRYYAGGSYMFQNGNFENLNMNKYTMRLGLDVDIAKGWLLSLGMNGSSKSLSIPYNALDKEPEKMYNTYSTLLRTPGWLPSFINGLPVGQGGTVMSHPLYINDINTYNKSYSGNIASNMALQWEIPWVKGLKAKASFDYLRGNSGGITYAKPYYLYNFETVPTDYSSGFIPTDVVSATTPTTYITNGDKYQQSANTSNAYQLNVTLDYARKFGLHDISASLIFEQSQNKGTELSGSIEKMIIDNVESAAAFGDGVTPTLSGKWATPTGRQAFLGRFNYNYADKYLLETTLRYEASTKFAPIDRWGFFPSVSVGWRVSQEPFFEDAIGSETIDNLKLRASFGRLGNDKANANSWENNYLYTGSLYYLGGSTLVGGISPNNGGISMQGITWEKADAYNVGFDAHFLNRFSFDFDSYYRHNYDILQVRSSALSYTTGISTSIPAENYGIQDSWGGEISVGYEGNFSKDWSFNVRGNLGYATSKVIKKFQAAAVIGTWKDEIGRIRGGETGYYSKGIMTQEVVDQLAATYGTYVDASTGLTKLNYTIFGVQPEAGMLNFEDVGGADYSNEPDGVIDENDERIISKYDSSPFNYGLSMSAGWKSVKLNITFDGAFGNDVVYDKAVYAQGEGNRNNFDWLSYKSNNLTIWKDHWTPENTDASMPRLYNGMANKRSTFWMRDGHELTMRSLTLSYDMPRSLLMKLGVPSLRVYFTGTNLLTLISPFPYKDPGLSSWMDYPIMRSFNLGINMNL